MLVHWLMDEGLMAKELSCPMCAGEMSLTRYEDRSDGLKWECRKQVNGKRHKVEVCCSYDLCTLLFATEKKRGASVACLYRLRDERKSHVHV